MMAVACYVPRTLSSTNVFTFRLMARGDIFLAAIIWSILRLGRKLMPAKGLSVKSPVSLSCAVAGGLPMCA